MNDQAMNALAYGNEMRLARGRWSKDVASKTTREGAWLVSDALKAQGAGTLPPHLSSVPVLTLVALPRQMGPKSLPRDVRQLVPRIFSRGGLRVSELTPREALVLAAHFGRVATGAVGPHGKES